MIKKTSDSSNWLIYDSQRDLINVSNKALYADSSAAEGTTLALDILSNGFKLRVNNYTNDSGASYVYAAFAEHPFKTARAR